MGAVVDPILATAGGTAFVTTLAMPIPRLGGGGAFDSAQGGGRRKQPVDGVGRSLNFATVSVSSAASPHRPPLSRRSRGRGPLSVSSVAAIGAEEAAYDYDGRGGLVPFTRKVHAVTSRKLPRRLTISVTILQNRYEIQNLTISLLRFCKIENLTISV